MSFFFSYNKPNLCKNTLGLARELTWAGRNPPSSWSPQPVGFRRGQSKIPWGIYRPSLEMTVGKALEAAGELKVFVVV